MEFAYESLTAMFLSIPRAASIAYLLHDAVLMFFPFSASRFATHEELSSGGHAHGSFESNSVKLEDSGLFEEVPLIDASVNFSLHLLHKNLIVPPFTIRKSRVEDCDDLVPMFKKYQVSRAIGPNYSRRGGQMLPEDATDYHVAKLIELDGDHVKSFVAEARGRVVGFMSLDGRFDASSLRAFYDLSAYESEIEGTLASHKASPSFSALQNRSARLTQATSTPALSQGASTGEGGFKQSHHDVTVVETVATAAAATKQNDAISSSVESAESSAPVMLTWTNAFCVTLFCIEDQFSSLAHEFIRVCHLHHDLTRLSVASLRPLSHTPILSHDFTVDPERMSNPPALSPPPIPRHFPPCPAR